MSLCSLRNLIFRKVFNATKLVYLNISSELSKMPTALIILADGAEDMETVVTADILRRAGIQVTIAGLVGKGVVQCSNKTKIEPDDSFCNARDQTYDVIVLPGGMGGTKAMIESCELGKVLQEQEKAGRKIAAICAAPTALKAHKICLGKNLTSYPAMKDQLKNDYEYIEDNVVVDGNLITSRGPGTAYQFGLKIAQIVAGPEAAAKVANACLLTMETKCPKK